MTRPATIPGYWTNGPNRSSGAAVGSRAGTPKRPPFWRPRWRKAHRKVVEIFARHGFIINRRVVLRFYTADSQQGFEDAGGAICRKLAYALDGQLLPQVGVQDAR